MSGQKKDFYVWVMAECIKSTYEYWGTDMMSMYDNINKNFPNATEAIKKMYTDFEPKICYKAKALNFKNPQFVYEAISNFVPVNEELK